jgi:hypothetical protein
LRTGGTLALVGGLGYFVALLFHGDLPDATTRIALEHIAGRPEWPLETRMARGRVIRVAKRGR